MDYKILAEMLADILRLAPWFAAQKQQGYAGHVLVREKILRVSSIAELTEKSAKPARTAEA